jgi:predicted nucleic-acid-binding protein
MNDRIIPKKNYIILVGLFSFCIVLTLYISRWYTELSNYYQTNTIVSEVIAEMEYDSLSSYLLDNHEALIYITSSTDQSIKKFEIQFKKYIIEYDLANDIRYLDVSKEENRDIIKDIMNNYSSKNLKKMKDIFIPNLLYFKDGKLVDILYIKETKINKQDVQNFIDRLDYLGEELND